MRDALGQNNEGNLICPDGSPWEHSRILGEIALVTSPYAPDGVCETAETVRHLAKVADAAKTALRELETIRTEKLAVRGLFDEANAISRSRVALGRLLWPNTQGEAQPPAK
jgi:hypothetical protein